MTSSDFAPTALAISIVSHGQGSLIRPLLRDLQPLVRQGAQILLTLNIPENESFLDGLTGGLTLLRNSAPKGFGDNHNSACLCTSRTWFAVLNPDIRCEPDVFETLAAAHLSARAGVCAPRVTDPTGNTEDSVRRYPSIGRILRRVFIRLVRRRPGADYDLADNRAKQIDWCAGMFLLFRTDDYRLIGGFDTRYFMYLEDADICRRMNSARMPVVVVPSVSVVHNAQRASGRNLRHLRWHLSSMVRFLFLAPSSRPPRALPKQGSTR